MGVCMHMYVDVCVCACVCVCADVCMCMCLCVHVTDVINPLTDLHTSCKWVHFNFILWLYDILWSLKGEKIITLICKMLIKNKTWCLKTKIFIVRSACVSTIINTPNIHVSLSLFLSLAHAHTHTYTHTLTHTHTQHNTIYNSTQQIYNSTQQNAV